MMSLFSCYFCPLGEARHHLNNIPSQSSARPQRPHSRLTIGTNGSHITITLRPPQSIQRILCRPGLPPTHDSNEHYHGCHFICMAQPPGIIIDLFNNVLLLSAKHVPTFAYVKPSSSDSNACMRTPPLRLLHFLLFCATFDTCFNDLTPLCHFNVIVLVLVSLQSSWHRRLRFFRARGVCGHIVAAYHSLCYTRMIQFDNLANTRIRCSRHLRHHISSIFITACHLRVTHGVMSR
jgi:hypothetical protein